MFKTNQPKEKMNNFKKAFIQYGIDHGHIKPITINAQDIINGKKEELEKIIPSNNYDPNKAYKKAVNTLKRKTK